MYTYTFLRKSLLCMSLVWRFIEHNECFIQKNHPHIFRYFDILKDHRLLHCKSGYITSFECGFHTLFSAARILFFSKSYGLFLRSSIAVGRCLKLLVLTKIEYLRERIGPFVLESCISTTGTSSNKSILNNSV